MFEDDVEEIAEGSGRLNIVHGLYPTSTKVEV